MKKIILMALVSLSFNAFASKPKGGSDVGNAVDSSAVVSFEEGKAIVQRGACLTNGGIVSDQDKRYILCEGGKYDGYLTVGPAVAKASCNLESEYTKDMLDKNGNVDDESIFLQMGQSTVAVCAAQASDFSSLKDTIQKAKQSCDAIANQGQSILFRGLCYQKIGELASFIMMGR